MPTHHLLNNIRKAWAVDSYHWFFMAQPYDYPEQMLIAYGLERYIRKKLDKPGVGMTAFTPEALAEYIRCCTPENIHAVCEDYRAAVSIDLEHDAADLDVRLAMPMLVLWGERSHVNRSYRPLEAWRERAARRPRPDAALRPLPGRAGSRCNLHGVARFPARCVTDAVGQMGLSPAPARSWRTSTATSNSGSATRASTPK